MLWPETPIEFLRVDAFEPEFCPRRGCAAHASDFGGPFRFRREGSYHRVCDDRVVRRYRCLHCNRGFSAQSFSTTYYLKRPELLPGVAEALVAGSAHRQIARTLHCAPNTVTRLAARLGRHAILLQSRLIQEIPYIDEFLVHDDFETFAYSQEQPLGIGTTVGRESWFVYAIQLAPHRRGGRKRRGSRKLRRRGKEMAERDLRRSYTRALRKILALLADKTPPGQRIVISTDDHPAYPPAMQDWPYSRLFRHRVFPNPHRPYKGAPRSPEARLRDREMFPVDALHALMRHSLAHFRRETIAFGRRHNAVMERAFVFVVWRNLIKGRSERRPDRTTPAMWLGLTDAAWDWRRLLAQRLFPSRLKVPEAWMRIYRRDWITPAVGVNQRHRLRNAF
jgi:transposase-like protein